MLPSARVPDRRLGDAQRRALLDDLARARILAHEDAQQDADGGHRLGLVAGEPVDQLLRPGRRAAALDVAHAAVVRVGHLVEPRAHAVEGRSSTTSGAGLPALPRVLVDERRALERHHRPARHGGVVVAGLDAVAPGEVGVARQREEVERLLRGALEDRALRHPVGLDHGQRRDGVVVDVVLRGRAARSSPPRPARSSGSAGPSTRPSRRGACRGSCSRRPGRRRARVP